MDCIHGASSLPPILTRIGTDWHGTRRVGPDKFDRPSAGCRDNRILGGSQRHYLRHGSKLGHAGCASYSQAGQTPDGEQCSVAYLASGTGMDGMNPSILREFLRLLTRVRTGDYRDRTGHFMGVGRCLGFSNALHEAGIITMQQYFAVDNLAMNAFLHAGEPFPSALNAGPVMPAGVAFDRRWSAVKPSAQVPANEYSGEVSAPAPHTGLRLLCLLVPSRTGETRSLPVHTMRPMPPAVLRAGRWSLASDSAFVLRETQAIRPTAEVLERCLRQRQTNAVCADSRTVRSEGVSYVR